MTCVSCFESVVVWWSGSSSPSSSSSTAKASTTASQDSIIQDHFDKFSKDGRMDVHQFKDLCKENEKAYALEEPEVFFAFVTLDDDDTGYIEFAEFQRWCRLEDGRAGHLRFESAAMQRRVSDAMEAFKREVGSRMCMSEVQFELHCCKNEMHLQGAQLRAKFKSLDKDSDNSIDFSEYLRWRLKDSPFESDHHQLRPAAPDGGMEPERKDAKDLFLENMFSRFDVDGDRTITKEEMTEKNETMEMFDIFSTVHEGSVQEKVEEYFREMDTDGDGIINLEEFMNYFKPMLP